MSEPIPVTSDQAGRPINRRTVAIAAGVTVALAAGGIAAALTLGGGDAPTAAPSGAAAADPTDADAPLDVLSDSVVAQRDATPPAADPAPAPSDESAETTLYVNPYTQAAEAAAAASGADRAVLERIAGTPQSLWVVYPDAAEAAEVVRDYTTRAADAGALGVLVIYEVPGRDCGEYSAGGVEGSEYARWVDAVAAAVVGEPLVVLEPDALASLGDCDGQGDRVGYLRYAAQALTGVGARVYVDAGHSGWLSAQEAADRLNQIGLGDSVGFALNTSNYQTTADSIAYGEQVSALTGGAPYVVDTSRNGNGSNGEWCNPRGRAVGEQPRLVDDATNLDALLWVKAPGESDGTCNGGPGAGQWWGEIALELAHNAGW